MLVGPSVLENEQICLIQTLQTVPALLVLISVCSMIDRCHLKNILITHKTVSTRFIIEFGQGMITSVASLISQLVVLMFLTKTHFQHEKDTECTFPGGLPHVQVPHKLELVRILKKTPLTFKFKVMLSQKAFVCLK